MYIKKIFRGSSVVEQSTVNRSVVGSNPTRGANSKTKYSIIFYFYLLKINVIILKCIINII